jgi:hypothetical protein
VSVPVPPAIVSVTADPANKSFPSPPSNSPLIVEIDPVPSLPSHVSLSFPFPPLPTMEVTDVSVTSTSSAFSPAFRFSPSEPAAIVSGPSLP